MPTHSFDTGVAQTVGVNAAVIYSNILFWTQKNIVNRRNIRDGKVWTFNSVKAWGELFPYMTASQIRTSLQRLEDAGLIASGNYNENAYDRTKWYGVPCEVHLSNSANGIARDHEPIPDSKPDTKPDGNLFGVSDETPKPKAKRAVTIPSNWVPSDKNLDDAFNANFTQEEIDHEAAAFRDYHLQKGTAFKDWDAGWRTWLRNSRKFSPAASQDRRAAAKSDALRREIALVATARGAPSEDPF